jgi:hypothetical protein
MLTKIIHQRITIKHPTLKQNGQGSLAQEFKDDSISENLSFLGEGWVAPGFELQDSPLLARNSIT